MEPTNAILMQPFEADHAQKLYEIWPTNVLLF
jgi:hypothetical protein